jgi:hypothetical protein
MRPIIIAPDSSFEELAKVAVSVHNAAMGLPVAIKARDRAGVLVDEGGSHVAARECTALDDIFSGEGVQRIKIREGKHNGSIMFASAIVNGHGQRVAAIGIIDKLGILSLNGFAEDEDRVDSQLHRRRPRR